MLFSNLTARTILQHLCKDKNYFLHLKKIETNFQNGYKDKDQNAYSFRREGKMKVKERRG